MRTTKQFSAPGPFVGKTGGVQSPAQILFWKKTTVDQPDYFEWGPKTFDTTTLGQWTNLQCEFSISGSKTGSIYIGTSFASKSLVWSRTEAAVVVTLIRANITLTDYKDIGEIDCQTTIELSTAATSTFTRTYFGLPFPGATITPKVYFVPSGGSSSLYFRQIVSTEPLIWQN